ncbi:MAG: nicotinate-nucleotide adenylyltransferase [Deltaproteobacteria bacterium]|nr:nicotinate-nucleotide adenylyltransferase [Deltaproteobacteria bacterium]
MKWGLLGGTFDPIHFGHLRCAVEILEIFDLNRIVFIPATKPPHKLDAKITSFSHREQMIRAAIEDNPSFSFSDVENQRQGVSYSVDTVDYFLEKYLDNLELYFILGQDAFHAIHTWKDWQRLLTLCNIIVMTRPGYENKGLSGIVPEDFAARFEYDDKVNGLRGPTGHYIYFTGVTFLDISSSKIRQWTNEGKSIKYLTPSVVRHYIHKNKLYQD